jgi:hypothetical protein
MGCVLRQFGQWGGGRAERHDRTERVIDQFRQPHA